ncbi:MAG: ROK family protein [Lacisediminihabitans sp.]
MQNKVVRPLSSVAVRPHNRRLLLQLLRLSGEMSRAELAVQSGLSPAAVTNVIADLMQSGLVQELAPPPAPLGRGRLGRPGTLVSLAQEKQVVLAVQIGAGVLQVGVCDLEANLLASELSQFPLSSTAEEVLDTAVVMLERVIEASGITLDDVLGIGVGAAGLVDREQRVNLSSPNLGWTNVAMADYLENAFGRPTVVDHNVRAMAMGEVSYGLGRGLESLAFIYIRTGVGAGLVLGGSEYRGGTHGAVEFGHIRVVPGGQQCNCGGRGCLETVAGDRIIREQVAAAGLIPDAASADGESPAVWAGVLLQAVQNGDRRAVAIRDELVEHVARALLAVINLLNPQMIVLGGLLADLSDIILEPLREVIPSQVLPIIQDGIRIERATFGAEAGLIGAATVALGRFVFGKPLLLLSKAS